MSPLDSTQEAASRLASLKAMLASLAAPPGLESASRELPRMRAALANLERRLAEGPDAPLRVAFFGPTGAGKSKLFNSLLGSTVSPAGFRRPFTMRPVYSLHEAHDALAPRMEGEVKLRGGSDWRDVLFIDTPDFDSVERHNRDEAERIFGETEAFVFVTDVQKYADQSTWEYLERIFHGRKTAVIVLNKVVGPDAERDFRAKLEQRFGASDVVSIREHSIDDATLLPPGDGSLAALRERLTRLGGAPGERRAALTAAFRADLDELFASWEAARVALDRYSEGLRALADRLGERYRRAADRLGDEIAAPVDSGLKAEVYARVLERIQSIDLLRYPRRLLALPFEGLKMLAGKWWPSRKGDAVSSAEERARNESLQALEHQILVLAEASRDDFRKEARCPALIDREAELELRIPHDELGELHARADRAYREWLEREARETASKLTSENKVKFILSQVIYNAVVVGVQIHTAGHFTLVEAATDGVLSPLVAKAVGMAVSSERVGELERIARAEHQRAFSGILASAEARFRRHLDARGSWRAAYEPIARELEAFRVDRGALVAAFEREDEPRGEPHRRLKDAIR